MSDEKQQLHLLTLDNSWHQVFDAIKNGKMKALEKQINGLIIEQSKGLEDLKAYKAVKKDLMDTIMTGMSDAMTQPKLRRKLERAKHQIEEVNNKVKTLETRLGQIPKLINDTNEALMDESMALYYKQVKSQKGLLNQLDQEIEALRTEITFKMLTKNEAVEKYEELNKFIINLIGPEHMDYYDRKYLDE